MKSRIVFFQLLLLHLGLAQQPSELKPIFEVAGTDSGSRMGQYVKGIGDLNKDGYADVAVSAPRRLKTFVYYGGNPMSSEPALILEGGGVIVSGDFNGDGWIDLAIEKWFKDTVLVYYGGEEIDTIPDLILGAEYSGDLLGYESLAAGDVNGDGYDDLVIGAQLFPYTGPDAWRGKIYLFGGGANLDSIPRWTAVGDSANFRLGTRVAVGRVTGGLKAAVVALGWAPIFNTANYNLNIYSGKPDFQLTRNLFYDSRAVPYGFGIGVASFDADGDGIDDFLVDGIRIFKGGEAMDSLPAHHIPPPGNDTLSYGKFPRVGGGGDFNGDGSRMC
ncbi:MAG: VCBS repeat-containing protein [Bacteroidota bacterium]